MITGFNTDVEHDGTVYHVQTEDKGLETPFILSLVYVGGAILASKRSPYDDLVASGFDAVTLNERLHRQHKLICAAISAGRIEDLKKLSQRETGDRPARAARPVTPTGDPDKSQALSQSASDDPATNATQPPVLESSPIVPVPDRLTAHSKGENGVGRGHHGVPDPIHVELDEALHIDLLEEKDFRAGEIVTLRVRVTRGTFGNKSPLTNAAVTVKVLGTEFRPLILTAKTDQDGLAVAHVWLPRFTKGRAAILIRAAADGYTAELRRVIHHV